VTRLPVEIVDYDPEWPRLFAGLRERLLPALRDLPVEIEHVGSTAVPGLAAKPIIDIDVVVPQSGDVPRVIERLARIGYEHEGDLGVAGREAFRQPTGLPEHHLYAVVRGNAAHRRHIQLCDYLRSHPAVAARYGELKGRLAKRHGAAREGYTEAKSKFIDEVLRQASVPDERAHKRIRSSSAIGATDDELAHEEVRATASVHPDRYPLLTSIQEATWGSAKMRFVFEPEPPVPGLVGNVRCAGFSGHRVLVIETVEFGLSAFPGGMLEPGEDWTHALERELQEEAGARLLSLEVVGRIHFWSGLAAPYRPHLPHPEFHQVVAFAEAEVVGTPTNPPDGEHVLSAELIPIDEAIELLRVVNPFEAELLGFVADVRETR
jgi:GrpB-like predicted nucleotidyltransferase (UPF0157 family)/8-oxo-dGTP pyrophosphatase MutT (NUDIX family)